MLSYQEYIVNIKVLRLCSVTPLVNPLLNQLNQTQLAQTKSNLKKTDQNKSNLTKHTSLTNQANVINFHLSQSDER